MKLLEELSLFRVLLKLQSAIEDTEKFEMTRIKRNHEDIDFRVLILDTQNYIDLNLDNISYLMMDVNGSGNKNVNLEKTEDSIGKEFLTHYQSLLNELDFSFFNDFEVNIGKWVSSGKNIDNDGMFLIRNVLNPVLDKWRKDYKNLSDFIINTDIAAKKFESNIENAYTSAIESVSNNINEDDL